MYCRPTANEKYTNVLVKIVSLTFIFSEANNDIKALFSYSPGLMNDYQYSHKNKSMFVSKADIKILYNIKRQVSSKPSTSNTPINDKDGKTKLEKQPRWKERVNDVLNRPKYMYVHPFEQKHLNIILTIVLRSSTLPKKTSKT